MPIRIDLIFRVGEITKKIHFLAKTGIVLFLCFVLSGGFLFAQSSAVDEQSIILSNSSSSSDSSSTVEQSSGTVWLFVRMIIVLVIVVACIYGIVWLLKKTTQPGAEDDPFLKKTASITLAPGKSVQVVTLQDKAFVLGVSDSQVNLIAEITDKELIDSMNLAADREPKGKAPDFASMLANLTGSTKKTEEYLRNRRESRSNPTEGGK